MTRSARLLSLLTPPEGDRLVFKTIIQPRRQRICLPPACWCCCRGCISTALVLVVGRADASRPGSSGTLRQLVVVVGQGAGRVVCCSCWATAPVLFWPAVLLLLAGGPGHVRLRCCSCCCVWQRVTPEFVFLAQIYSRPRATVVLFVSYQWLAISLRRGVNARPAKCYPCSTIGAHWLCGTVTNRAGWVAFSHTAAPAALAAGACTMVVGRGDRSWQPVEDRSAPRWGTGRVTP